MKVWQTNLIILGTKKSLRIFPIKQEFDTTAVFFYGKKVQSLSNLGILLTVFFVHCATYLLFENTVRTIVKLDQIEHFGLSKKATMVSNFFLIGKIHRNFLVPRKIELGY